MPIDKINGVNLYWELTGSKGEPLVLVHGSWGDHHNWDMVVGEFSKTFRVLTYDRRGHSQSERPSGQGHVEEDVEDLIGLIEHLNLSSAYIAGNSYGAIIVLKTAAKRPDLFNKMIIHEPPLLGLIKDNPGTQEAFQMLNSRIKSVMDLIAAGNMEKATEEFMENLGMGPGTWQKLPQVAQKIFIYNAPTWYDEMHDPNSLEIDLYTLSDFKKAALLSTGSASPPFFSPIIDKIMTAIPHAKRIIIEGAGHVPHMSHPKQYIEVVKNFCLTNT
jgi:pimeloyl-ACP methyl ester carboxylesterase